MIACIEVSYHHLGGPRFLAISRSQLLRVHIQDFARLPWQNQSGQSASTLAGPPSGSSISVSAPYASGQANGQANGPAYNGGHSQAVLGNGGIHQVTELGVDELDLRGHTSLRLNLFFAYTFIFKYVYHS